MKHTHRLLGIFMVLTMCGIITPQAQADNHKFGIKKKMGMKKRMGKRTNKNPYAYYEKRGLFKTGLTPVFPESLNCPGISSPYGSLTRYDGSRRNNDHHGYHNGMDITLDTGTPLLATADGEVIHKGTAGQLVGNYIWLRFPPAATDLPVYIFARYQHLNKPASLNIGDKVKAGDTVGLSGNTGTTGGHFGRAGYPHLHLFYQYKQEADFKIKGPMVGPANMHYLDPVALYLPPGSPIGNKAARDLPKAQKLVNIPAVTTNGTKFPPDTKVVWPVACSN